MADAIPPRQLIAFLAMCFGMFMAFLDIQIVSSSLNDIQAGLSASADEIPWVQTAYLIAEVIAIPLSGFLSRALGTRILFAGSAAGFTLASVMCGTSSSIDSMIVWRALQGFIGGGMVPTVFASAYVIFQGPRQKFVAPVVGLIATLGADHRPHGRRLSDRHLLLALAVFRQRRAWHRRHRDDLSAGRLRPARFRTAEKFRLVRADQHGRIPRRARIRARGGPALRMVRRRYDLYRRHRFRGLGGVLLRPRAHRAGADRRSCALSPTAILRSAACSPSCSASDFTA